MQAYAEFAKVYDMFMDDIPYDYWAKYIHKLLREHEINDGLLLDLGCGTGRLTTIFSDIGYDMIGADNSDEMLNIAMENREDRNILYLLQDMRELELYGTVRAAFSICDCVNYILEPDDLVTVFKLVNNYLDPKGIFIFDFNSVYKYKNIIGETTIAENRDEGSFIWENYFDEEDNINQYDLTLFIKEENGMYNKYEETHFQRAYTLAQMKNIVELSGLKLLNCYDAFTKNNATEECERIYMICEECGK